MSAPELSPAELATVERFGIHDDEPDRELLFRLWQQHGSTFESDSFEGWELVGAILAAGFSRQGKPVVDREALANWLGEQDFSRNVRDYTDEETTVATVAVEALADALLAPDGPLRDEQEVRADELAKAAQRLSCEYPQSSSPDPSWEAAIVEACNALRAYAAELRVEGRRV